MVKIMWEIALVVLWALAKPLDINLTNFFCPGAGGQLYSVGTRRSPAITLVKVMLEIALVMPLASRGHVGFMLGTFGLPLGAILGLHWVHIEPAGGLLGPLGGHVELMLGPLGLVLSILC